MDHQHRAGSRGGEEKWRGGEERGRGGEGKGRREVGEERGRGGEGKGSISFAFRFGHNSGWV